jgi:hypothetical protein
MKTSITLLNSKWERLIHFIVTDLQNMNEKDEARVDMEEILNTIRNKMSRSSRKEPEAVVVSPLEFAGVHGKTFAISSKEREPIEQLLPNLAGNILILTSWTPNLSGIDEARKKGRDKAIVHKSITKICEIQMVMKVRQVAVGFDHIIVDRIDEIDNGKNKMQKAAQIKGMLTQIPGLLGKANMFITTMMGIPILYENVDEHKTV